MTDNQETVWAMDERNPTDPTETFRQTARYHGAARDWAAVEAWSRCAAHRRDQVGTTAYRLGPPGVARWERESPVLEHQAGQEAERARRERPTDPGLVDGR